MPFCKNCGAQVEENASFCPSCGTPTDQKVHRDAANASPKSRLVALLLCLLVGVLGIHRFYVGKVGTGVLWLLTGGCLGIGCLVDLILIICGSFTDKEGKFVSSWDC